MGYETEWPSAQTHAHFVREPQVHCDLRDQGSGKLLLTSKSEETFEFTWRAYEVPSRNNLWQSIDVTFEIDPTPTSETQLEDIRGSEPLLFGSSSPGTTEFFAKCLEASSHGDTRVVKLIMPLAVGQITRADIIPIRFHDSEFVAHRIALANPLQEYSGKPAGGWDLNHLPGLLSTSAGALVLQEIPRALNSLDPRTFSNFVEAEAEERLSFPWIVTPKSSQTLVIVEGSRVHPIYGGTGPNIYLAAKALGIKMVVLDKAGHWLEGPEYAHWREAFVPIDLPQPPDETFHNRIAEAVCSYGEKIDGIITFCDSYQAPVARAAQVLGLSNDSPRGLEIATNKYETSIFEGRKAHMVSTVQEALDVARFNRETLYPCIIKPCNGWSSEGVFRIDHESEWPNALQLLRVMASSRHGRDFVIEKYCPGPEVDVNFVMLDGEILFFEVCDDFPKTADVNGSGAGSVPTFIEQDSVFPSRLPESEINLLRICFHNTLLRLGLRNGVMHLEGRIDNSGAEYRSDCGVFDLYKKGSHQETPATPSAWLIEINPRPPGMKGTQIIESTYGVEYWGLAMLIALRDKERAKALSYPYKSGPQYNCVMVFIPADYDLSTCQGIFESDDVCAELLERRPDLKKNISRYGCLVQRGQQVPHPSKGVNSFLAYFNVFSRRGRQDALRLATIVREEVKVTWR
ncbi:MAG: hypothetical protein M1820_001859 [Bogoriella megaspora]|nr:MAG: hypothetical protein M1820_001859 [Bogoriella megaspora]